MCYGVRVRIIARPALIKFCSRPDCRDAKQPLDTWYHEAKRAKWRSWPDIKQKYRSASVLKNNRVVFNIGGNKYRLVVAISYPAQVIYIRFIGTHQEYDRINAEEI
ncbi:MAG: type II toxin-antitoxin system HigB family toxin [Chloroflexota bacterium]|nr:type II toxin-antitoxin system HigB family toxin [Chloroflexota bacterium]